VVVGASFGVPGCPFGSSSERRSVELSFMSNCLDAEHTSSGKSLKWSGLHTISCLHLGCFCMTITSWVNFYMSPSGQLICFIPSDSTTTSATCSVSCLPLSLMYQHSQIFIMKPLTKIFSKLLEISQSAVETAGIYSIQNCYIVAGDI
jgi:hypothetical protein